LSEKRDLLEPKKSEKEWRIAPADAGIGNNGMNGEMDEFDDGEEIDCDI